VDLESSDPANKRWRLLIDDADDSVLLRLFGYLAAIDVLKFAAAAPSVSERLTGVPSGSGTAVDGLSQMDAIAQQLAASCMGGRNAGVVAALAAARAAGSMSSIRAAAWKGPPTQVLQLAVKIGAAARSKKESQWTDEQEHMCMTGPQFLEALFSLDASRSYTAKLASGAPVATAWSAAFTALLQDEDIRLGVTRAASAAACWAERKLDELVENGEFSRRGAFDSVARARSAIEFLLDRFGVILPAELSKEVARCKDAVASLDSAMESYSREGYDLECHTLKGGAACRKFSVPYQHWWVFMGGTGCETGMCA